PPCDDHDSSRRHSLSFCSSYPDLRDLHSFPTRRSSDLGGALGYWALPVSALPQVDFPTVQVSTQLPGASPDVVASLITAPLERQDRKSTRLNSSHVKISYAVFCLKKKRYAVLPIAPYTN